MPSILNPREEEEDIVSLHCMYRGFEMAHCACSSAVGSLGLIFIIFSYMSCGDVCNGVRGGDVYKGEGGNVCEGELTC